MVVALEKVIPDRVFQLVLAQQQQLLVYRSHLGNLPKTEELPIALAGVRRIEDVVEPALRFGEPLVLAEVNRNSKREMEQQLPIVIRVRSAAAEIDLFRMVVYVEIKRAGMQLVEGIEEL